MTVIANYEESEETKEPQAQLYRTALPTKFMQSTIFGVEQGNEETQITIEYSDNTLKVQVGEEDPERFENMPMVLLA